MRLMSGTMLMVDPVCFQRQVFLPCVASEEWSRFGMEAQRRHAQPFVRICNTNQGVAKMSRAALGRVGIGVDVLEREGYLGDPSVKGSLRILPRVVAARPRRT